MINKKLIVIAFSALVITSCSKSGDENPEPAPVDSTNTNNNNNGTVPATFTQKVLLEEFTGSWCQTCPDADYKRDQVIAANPGKVIAVAVHETDAMEIPLIWELDGAFNTNIPSGMINRTPSTGNVILNQSQWMSNTTVAANKTAKCGLAINSTVSGTTASINVRTGFKETLTGNYHLTVYLVENKVTGTGSGYSQANAYNTSSGSPFYNDGNPIVGYEHNYVARKVLSADDLGDVIDASSMQAGKEYVKNFTANISGYNQANLYVVAFVNKVGISATTHEIMNVQNAKIATLKNYD